MTDYRRISIQLRLQRESYPIDAKVHRNNCEDIMKRIVLGFALIALPLAASAASLDQATLALSSQDDDVATGSTVLDAKKAKKMKKGPKLPPLTLPPTW
jgi:hypothetical protein